MRLAASASLFLLLVGPTSTPRTGTPSIPDADRSRIAEAFRVADGVGDRIWPGWHAVPFAILLITDSTEFLIHHPHPTSDFTPAGTDPALGPIWVRPRRLPVTLLATAPFVGGIPTIAVGRAEAVGQSSVEWVLTLLHEHFHQLQYGQPGYYAAVAALGLAHGDSTGMWMLNYPFPYDSVPVVRAIDSLAAALVTVLDAARPGADAPAPSATDVGRYRAARTELRHRISADDDRYLEFQLWQEGVARYTEYALAVAASKAGLPSAGFRALPDYVNYTAAAAGQLARLHRELAHAAPETNGRVIVYSLGAATALLLDRTHPDWKSRYFKAPLALEPLFTSR